MMAKLRCSLIVLDAIKNTTMKTSILTIAIAAIFVACNPQPAVETVAVNQTKTDTSGFSEFQQWKDQQDIIGEEALSFTTDAPVEEDIAQVPVKPTVIYRQAPARTVAKARQVTKSRPAVSRPQSELPSTIPSSGESTVGTGDGNGDIGTYPAETPIPAKKEGWSKAAKGTAIGGASGAVLGAIISKDKKGLGAVIGGVVGADGGYVLGRAQDKKDGRVNYN